MTCFIHFKGKNYLEEDFLRYVNSNSKKIFSPRTSISDYTLHSGGALGSDTVWDKIGENYGLKKTRHYYKDSKTPLGNFEISNEDIEEGRYKSAQAAKRNYGYSHATMKSPLLIRNYSQVKHADAVFAIGTIAQIGENMFPHQELKEGEKPRLAINPTVTGGTSYAVSMAINENKPVYVFDQLKEKWYQWDNNENNFIETETPILTPNFAGIGTGQINEAGKKAIEDVYKKTLSQTNKSNGINNNLEVNSIEENNTNTFITKISKFNYTLNTSTGEVIHNSKTKGDIVETMQKQINKVYVAYAKAMNYPTIDFNKSTYVKVFDRILNIQNANEVTHPKIQSLFQDYDSLIKKPCSII